MGSASACNQSTPRDGTLTLPSPVARLLRLRFAASPRHVDPDRTTLSIQRRVYETVVNRFSSGPFGRGVGLPPRVAAKSPSLLLKSAVTPPAATFTTSSSTATTKPILPQLQVFSAATTALATTAFTNSAVLVLKRSREVHGSRSSTVSMPAISFVPGSSATSTTTTTTTNTDTATPTATYSLKSLTKKFSAPQLSQTASSHSLDIQDPLSSTTTPSAPRPSSISPQSKHSLKRENSDNASLERRSANSEDTQRSSIFRRLSPSLAARVKFLNGSTEGTSNNALGRSKGAVGKIPQDHLRELDNLHQDLSIKVEKRGRIWTGLQIKRERSAPDLLQSPTKTQTTTSAEQNNSQPPPPPILDPEQVPVQLAPSIIDKPVPPLPISDNTDTSTIEQLADARDSDDGVAASTMTTVVSATMVDGSNSIPQDVEPVEEGSTDLEEYLRRSTLEDSAPPLPPKDTPPVPSTPSSGNVQSYFPAYHKLNRAESIYSFSRASFSNQLSQLTSINLPQPAALEASISSIINAPTAVRALIGAAEQIEKWMNKASEVLNGLDAEDDVEWAAAGGREGLDEVDKAVEKFESLVNVYVKAIENVQLRDDIDDVRGDDLKLIVTQMDTTLQNWASIRTYLRGVKQQVELAMEWEELWNNVLGDVGMEIDNLTRLIFEMEERRHKSLAPDPEGGEPGNGLDINELETIVEETPLNGTPSSANKRLSLALFPAADNSNSAEGGSNPQDDANLMQLFARMQPLRASLDFLPMRLSMFQTRAEKLFPTACDELEDRRKRLESTYKKLESDAEALRRELGEDRWILVFRNAGKQAQKMCESVERSISKLQESLESSDPMNNPTAVSKKVESYEAKKVHYVPAIGRVMSIIQKGVNDRLTVNGEILTLLSDMNQRVDAVKKSMQVMDAVLEETAASRSQQLRDSISSIITTDSPANTSRLGTPGSSPASSVIVAGYTSGLRTPNAVGVNGSSRRGSSVGSTSRSVTGSRRMSGIPTSANSNRKGSGTLSVYSPLVYSPSNSVTTPTPPSRTSRIPTTPAVNRPRWNGSTNVSDLDVGHNFRSAAGRSNLPIPGRTTRSVSSSLPIPSPLSRATSSSPVPAGRTSSRTSYRPGSRLGTASPTSPTVAGRSLSTSTTASKHRKPISFRNRQSYGGPMTMQQSEKDKHDAATQNRPGTALGHSSRRTSLLPQMKSKSGRDSSAGQHTNSISKADDRPPWR